MMTMMIMMYIHIFFGIIIWLHLTLKNVLLKCFFLIVLPTHPLDLSCARKLRKNKLTYMKHLSIQLQHGECRVLIDVCRCTTVVTERAFVWDQLSTTNWQGPDWLHVPVLVFSMQHRQQNYPCVTSQRHAFPDYRARVLRTINTNRNKFDYVYYCFMIVFFLIWLAL